MEKFKVDKKTFDALEKWKEKRINPFKTAMELKSKGSVFISNDFLPLNNLDMEQLAKCLIVGYELKETPEEKLLNLYKMDSSNEYENGIDRGIKMTLDILNIKIKGINS